MKWIMEDWQGTTYSNTSCFISNNVVIENSPGFLLALYTENLKSCMQCQWPVGAA